MQPVDAEGTDSPIISPPSPIASTPGGDAGLAAESKSDSLDLGNVGSPPPDEELEHPTIDSEHQIHAISASESLPEPDSQPEKEP